MSERRQHHDLKSFRAGRSREHLKMVSVEVRKEKRGELAKRFRGVSENERHQVAELTDPSETLQRIAASIRISADLVTTKSSLKSIRLVLSIPDPPIREVIQIGLVQFLISSLLVADDSVKSDAMWCLTNIGSGDTDQTREVLPAVPILLQILSGGSNVLLSEQVCWVLGNIAGDSDECRDVLVKNGALKPVLEFLLTAAASTSSIAPPAIRSTSNDYSPSEEESKYNAPAQTAAWALSNIARGSTSGHVFVQSGSGAMLIPKLVSLLGHPDTVLVKEISWVLAFLTAKEEDAVDFLVGANCISFLISASTRFASSDTTCIPIIRSLGNLSSGPIRWLGGAAAATVPGADGPSLLSALIDFIVRCTDVTTAHRAVVKESLWVLANILGCCCSAGGGMVEQQQLQQSIAIAVQPYWSQLMQHSMQSLLSDLFDLQREAIVVLQNALIVDHDGLCALLATKGPLEQMVRLLRVPDSETVATTLRVLKDVASLSRETVQLCASLDLYDALDEIQYGPGEDEVRRMARTLADELFEGDDDDDNHDEGCYYDAVSVSLSSAAQTAASISTSTSASSDNPNPNHSFAPYSLPADSSSPNGSGTESGVINNYAAAGIVPVALSDHSTSPPLQRGMGRGSHMAKPAWMT